MAKASFLGLPREIRDQVYLHFVTRRTPPPYPPVGGPKRGATHTHPHLLRLPRLAAVSHQLHDEILDLARQQYRSGNLTPELDIMVKGYSVYSAWTIVPMTIKRGIPFNISTSIRIFSTEAFLSTEDWPPRPGEGFRSLLSLINNLLSSGPSLRDPDPNFDSVPFCVDKLSVSITFHDLYTPHTWPGTCRTIFKMLKGFAVSGIAYPYVKVIHAKACFKEDGKDVVRESEWNVSNSLSSEGLEKFEMNGFQFLLAPQHHSELPGFANLALKSP